MHERQRVYLKRQAGHPFPWTDDPILRDYRFENIYREQDRETLWFAQNWREPYATHANLWFSACLFRIINWSPTLAEVGFPDKWDPDRVLGVLESRLARGEKTFTSAYHLQHHGVGSKARYAVHRVLDPLWKATRVDRFRPWKQREGYCLQSAHSWLSQFFGLSGFTGYEIVTDLRHTRYLRNAPDINTWANPGPGATRGIYRVLGLDLNTRIPRNKQIQCMREIYAWLDQHREKAVLPTLEMRDVEHSLCAFDKYRRAHENRAAGCRVSLERFSRPQLTFV